MFDEFHQTAAAIFESTQQAGSLVRNPDEASLAVDSEPMSRAAN
jgi:hypothetical protein